MIKTIDLKDKELSRDKDTDRFYKLAYDSSVIVEFCCCYVDFAATFLIIEARSWNIQMFLKQSTDSYRIVYTL